MRIWGGVRQSCLGTDRRGSQRLPSRHQAWPKHAHWMGRSRPHSEAPICAIAVTSWSSVTKRQGIYHHSHYASLSGIIYRLFTEPNRPRPLQIIIIWFSLENLFFEINTSYPIHYRINSLTKQKINIIVPILVICYDSNAMRRHNFIQQ